MSIKGGKDTYWTAKRGITQNGLVMHLDSSVSVSYPTNGNTLYDLTGNNNNGTLTNGPTFDSDNGGNISFDGSNDYLISTKSLYSPSSNPSESVFIWWYPKAAGQIVVELGQGTINSSWHDSNIEINASGIISFSIWHGGLGTKVTSTAKSFNQWYYLGFTYAGTTLTAYINGTSIGTATFTRSTTNALYYAIAAIDSTNMGTNAYGQGKLGIFQAYNIALSATEITQNYNATKNRFGL